MADYLQRRSRSDVSGGDEQIGRARGVGVGRFEVATLVGVVSGLKECEALL
jgi:hypothetical protein